MIVLLDTSTPICRLTIASDDGRYDTEWEADRALARGLLGFLETELHGQQKTFDDITGIGIFRGPGSFTGLRIGITVVNTLAGALSVPLVGVTGEDWQDLATFRLKNGENDRIVMPLYGSDARITMPRK